MKFINNKSNNILSKYIGVMYNKSNKKWYAQKMINNVIVKTKCVINEIDAAKLYNMLSVGKKYY